MHVLAGGYVARGHADDLPVLPYLLTLGDFSQRHFVAGGHLVAQPQPGTAGDDFCPGRCGPGQKSDAVVGP